VKNRLLLTTSTLALSLVTTRASISAPRYTPTTVLWNQNSKYNGGGVLSENFTSDYCTEYCSEAADDFVVPSGRIWKVTEVDVTGVYSACTIGVNCGPANSENVIFYKDHNGKPGRPINNGSFSSLSGVNGPNFAITLPGTGLKLRAGTYWVSVVPNMYFPTEGEWIWETNSVKRGNQAVWQNPGNGFGTGCKTWERVEKCLAQGPDLMFALRGKDK